MKMQVILLASRMSPFLLPTKQRAWLPSAQPEETDGAPVQAW